MSSRRFFPALRPLCFFILCAALFGSGCAARASEAAGKAQTGLATKTITLHGESAAIDCLVELARSDEERNAGLMFRTELEEGKGMLFIFEKDEVLSFWMKNTLIPLSIAYIGYDGAIIDIRNMDPHDTSSVSSSRSARYALEVPQGWFDKIGIKPGDTVSGIAEL
jgi:uncharacterized membrane protein (UPF0127 family)